MPCIPPMSCMPFMAHSRLSKRKPWPRLPSRRVSPAPLALLRSAPPFPLAFPVTRGNAALRYCPTRALPLLPIAPLQTREARRADQSLLESDKVRTCTRPAANREPAMGSRSIACKPRGCALSQCSQPQPCVPLASRRSPFRRSQHRHCSATAACKLYLTRPELLPALHFADQSCARTRRPRHPTPPDPPDPFLPAKIPMPSLAARGLRELFGGGAQAGVCGANLRSSPLLPLPFLRKSRRVVV